MPPTLDEILDSDDEAELSPLRSQDNRATVFSSGESARAPADLDRHMSEQGASSTEEQLRQAHLDLMAPTQDGNSSSISASVTGAKRRLTTSDVSPPTPSARQPKRTKTDPMEPMAPSSGATLPGATIPESAVISTGDTIEGATIPSMSMPERQTPLKRTRKPSTQSDEQSANLTPWSVSAIGSSGQRKELASSGEKRSQPRSSAVKQDRLPISDHLGSDEIAAIGLPKEQYKPRPSRSRSAQIVEDIDYSVRPEKAARVKRTRTTGSPAKAEDVIQVGSKIFPERPILESPGFEALSPPPEDASLRAEQEAVLELPTSNHASVSEVEPPDTKIQPKKSTKKLAVKPKQYGKRGRPRKQPQIVVEDDEDDEDELARSPKQLKSSPKSGQVEVQVIISPQNLTPASAESADTTQNDARDEKIAAQQDLASDIVARLKQTPAPLLDSKNDMVKEDDAGLANAPKIAKTPDSRPAQEDAPIERAAEDTNASQTAKPQSGLKISPMMGSSKPQTPLSRYRVGLSKTQRIPSLLRVLKK
ncbi:hypothetical protein MBLNU459_g1904t1 [Dothideomycetes sp. NU459]